MQGAVFLTIVYINGIDCLLRFANSYSDHMVLQRGPQRAILWGYADVIQDSVTVYMNDAKVAECAVQQDPRNAQQGIWIVKLPAETDPGPFEIKVRSSQGNITLTDILFGDVWLCSGQSNMRFRMRELINASDAIKDSLAFKDVRMLFTSLVQSATPLDDVSLIHSWMYPTKGVIDNFSALCFLYAKELKKHLEYPIGVIASSWGGTPIEVWSSPSAIEACPTTVVPRRWPTPSVLWNSMIYPYLRMTITGAIWYQGEGNRVYPDLYECQFPAMIDDWRKQFHTGSYGETSSEFPLGFVQLAPFRGNPNIIGRFPQMRWAQTTSMGYVPNDNMPNTFMAVAVDLPDFQSTSGSIHPRYKEDIAVRLSLGARHVAYNESKVKFQGPLPTDFCINSDNNTLTIIFDHNKYKLRVNDNFGFEVCCSDSSFPCGRNNMWTHVNITETDEYSVGMDVSVCQDSQLQAIRYLWRESPCLLRRCPIYDKDTQLPAPPFIKTWQMDNSLGSCTTNSEHHLVDHEHELSTGSTLLSQDQEHKHYISLTTVFN